MDTQLIGYLRTSYDEIMQLGYYGSDKLDVFQAVLESRLKPKTSIPRSKPIRTWSHDYPLDNRSRSPDTLMLDAMYIVTVAVFQHLKRESMPLDVILRYTADTLRWDTKINCAFYDVPGPTFMVWNGKVEDNK